MSSRVFKKLFKRCQKMFSTTKFHGFASTTIGTHHADVVRGDVTPLRSSLKDHFAAAIIQSAYRRHLNVRNVKSSLRKSTDPSRMTMDFNKSRILIEDAPSRIKVATPAASSSSLENSVEIQPDYVYLARNETNLQSSVKWLLKFHSRLLRWLQSTVRVKHPNDDRLKVGSSKNKVRQADHENEKSTDLNLKLHLEPKSRKKTLQRFLQHVSILDCYSCCSSTPDFSPRRTSRVDIPTGLMPVYLNIYDITPVSSCLYWLGIGLHHSGVQVNGVEYAFGTDEYGTAGIFRTKPKECEEFTFRKTILIGWTKLRSGEIRKVIDEIASRYKLDDYSLITRNCNHFSTEACIRLTGNSIPLWVNRLAQFGSLFVISGSNLRRKRICHCNSSASSSSLCSETSSEITVTGKSSRWKKSVTLTPSLSLDWVL